MKYDKMFKNSRLFPKVKYILYNIPTIYYFGDKHPQPCRQPAAIYNIASQEILESLNNAIEIFETYNINNNINIELFFNNLIEKCEKVIGNICSFYDECFLIFISISKPSTDNPIIASDWLKINGYDSGSLFKNYSYEAIEIWQKINNRLKHNNQKISYFLATENINHVEGFYIEGYTKDNSIAPDPTFHNKENKMSQGISFKKFFKEVFLSYFYISDNLLKVLEHHLKKNYSYKLDFKIDVKDNDDLIKKVWDKLSDIDYIYFPDEYKIKYSRIVKYRISYPHKSVIFNPRSMEIKVKFSGDGVTKNFQLPMIK